MITYKKIKTHLLYHPLHKDSFVTSKFFSNEKKFKKLSKTFGKYHLIEGREYFESPFKNLKERESEEFSNDIEN